MGESRATYVTLANLNELSSILLYFNLAALCSCVLLEAVDVEMNCESWGCGCGCGCSCGGGE